jgi:hypothetical protein
MYGHPPKKRLRIFIGAILRIFDSRSITRCIARTLQPATLDFLPAILRFFLRSDFSCILRAK